MNSADSTIHFNLSFSQNSVYLHVRLRERFVNPQLLKQLAVYKIKNFICPTLGVHLSCSSTAKGHS